MKSQILEKSLFANKNQTIIDNMFTEENVISGKIQWALNTVQFKFCFCSCEVTCGLFREIFPDSNTGHTFKDKM